MNGRKMNTRPRRRETIARANEAPSIVTFAKWMIVSMKGANPKIIAATKAKSKSFSKVMNAIAPPAVRIMRMPKYRKISLKE